ncbi:M48 family metallopeptidase [Candidatus Uhrbacteria bacterium]|nr:M48 family metallopeptidase [Candidatus Uhrbacteria bacterium]
MYNALAQNKRKSALLVFAFVLLLLALGWALGVWLGNPTNGLVIAGAIALLTTLIGYFAGDKVALAVAGAKKVERRDHPELYRLVENLAISEGLPTPSVYLISDRAPNAFAAGRDPKHAVIAVTQGLLDTLEKVELEGVLAHELGHIKNADVRFMTLVVVLVGSIILLSDMLTRSFLWGRDRDNRNAGPLLIVGLVLAILSPFIAELIKLAVSREREYLADATAAMTTRYPEGLARALEKIATLDQPLARANHATAHLYIANPFDPHITHRKFETLFSTHPPIEDRIRRLRSLGASA